MNFVSPDLHRSRWNKSHYLLAIMATSRGRTWDDTLIAVHCLGKTRPLTQVTCTAEWRPDSGGSHQKLLLKLETIKIQTLLHQLTENSCWSSVACHSQHPPRVVSPWPHWPSVFSSFFSDLIWNDNPWFGLFGNGRCLSTFSSKIFWQCTASFSCSQFSSTINNFIKVHYFRILMGHFQNQGQDLTQQIQSNCWKFISM